MATYEEIKDGHQQNTYGNELNNETGSEIVNKTKSLPVFDFSDFEEEGFEKTEDLDRALFIFKDGSLYSGFSEGGNVRDVDHGSIEYFIKDSKIDRYHPDFWSIVMQEVVQVVPESNSILMLENHEYSEEQQIKIKEYENMDYELHELESTIVNPAVSKEKDVEYTIDDIKSESYKILFKEIQKKYPSVAVLNINGNELMLDFFGKTNYSYNPDDGLVSESSIISSFGRGTVNRTSVIEEIYQSMEESGHMFQRAMNLGIELDEAFNFDELKQLFQKSTTEKELYLNISSIRSEVELEWSFSEVKTSKEIDSYKKENQQKLNEELRNGAIYFVNGEGTEYQVDPKRKLIGETKSNEDTKVVKVDNIFEFLKDKGAVACSAEAMEETKKNQIKSHQSERTNSQEKNQQQVVAAKRTNEGRSF